MENDGLVLGGDTPALVLYAVGWSAVLLTLIRLAGREGVFTWGFARSLARVRSKGGSRKLAAIAVAGLALLSLYLGLAGIERYGMSHVEVYVPGIDLPANISEPPPRLDLSTTVTWHLHREPHPPGYFIMMWFWTKLFGTSLFALRLPSVLFGAAAVVALYALAMSLFRSPSVGLLAAGLLALNGHNLFWMQSARMYEMALLLALLSTWLWVRVMQTPTPDLKSEIAYVAVTLAGVYSQVLFWPVLAAQMSFTLVQSSTAKGEPSRLYFVQTLCVT